MRVVFVARRGSPLSASPTVLSPSRLSAVRLSRARRPLPLRGASLLPSFQASVHARQCLSGLGAALCPLLCSDRCPTFGFSDSVVSLCARVVFAFPGGLLLPIALIVSCALWVRRLMSIALVVSCALSLWSPSSFTPFRRRSRKVEAPGACRGPLGGKGDRFGMPV